jgi:hypothetical protein
MTIRAQYGDRTVTIAGEMLVEKGSIIHKNSIEKWDGGPGKSIDEATRKEILKGVVSEMQGYGYSVEIW